MMESRCQWMPALFFRLGLFTLAWLSPSLFGAEPFAFFEPVRPARACAVMARGGAFGQAPENTRPALERCIEDGFEWAEVAVRLTKDGHHVLSRQDHLIVGINQAWALSEHTLSEIKEIDCGAQFAERYAGQRLLSLPECLALCKGRLNLRLDCAAVDLVQLAREILVTGVERQVVVCDSPANLQRLREVGQGRIALLAKWHPESPMAPWISSNHLAVVELDADQIRPEMTAKFHRLGVLVQANVLGAWDRPEIWETCRQAQVDWIRTDLPEEVLAHGVRRSGVARPVRMALHRGASRYAPENTLPAFEKAIRLGADLVEFDVRTTSNGRFYLLHDARLDGQTDGSGWISRTPAEVIDSLSAGVKFGRAFAQVRLATLDQFLSTVAGKVDCYFDAKAIPPEALAEAVERHRMTDRTIVYQSVPYLAKLRTIAPRLRRLPPLGSPGQLEEIVRTVLPCGVDVEWGMLSPDLITRCHSLGVQVFSDAVGEHERLEEYQRAIEWGIDVIQTDHPMRLLRAIELRRDRSR